MPGRLAQFFTWDGIHTRYNIALPDGESSWKPRYNISPTTDLLVLRLSDKASLQAAIVRFGLLPAWSKDEKMCLHNARAESLADKPSYREAFRKRRCIIPVNGFYEWTEEGKIKRPHFVELLDRNLLAFAGLWEQWVSPVDGHTIESATLVTCDAKAPLLPFDERMPVLLDSKEQEAWLDPKTDSGRLTPLLIPRDWPEMRIYRVSRRVNSGKVDGPECIEPNDD